MSHVFFRISFVGICLEKCQHIHAVCHISFISWLETPCSIAMELHFFTIACLLLCSNLLANAQRYDFFYFVLQWPGAYCDRQEKCCFPTTGRPARDFSIHGLWPNKDDGTYPEFCDPSNPFDASEIRDIRSDMNKEWGSLDCPSSNSQKFWEHEWEKHGTCAFSDQYQYFQDALQLRAQVDPLTYLAEAGIRPDNKRYSLTSIQLALERGLGHTIGIECNRDEDGTTQLYQLYFCVDSDASTIIDCPVFPTSRCSTQVEFPVFGGRGDELGSVNGTFAVSTK